MGYERELERAVYAARRAGAIQQRKRRLLHHTSFKADSSPVTEVDLRCEEVIHSVLEDAFLGDGFTGEETGPHSGAGTRRWIVDPLDGTRPYIRGIPTYSVLICLQDAGEFVVGVIHFPALRETYWASKGGGAFCNGNRIHVSGITRLEDAMGSCLGAVDEAGTARGDAVLSFMRQWNYRYGFMDAYSYMSVASGKLDLCLSLLDKPWDRAAAACIIAEAGGRYSDFTGERTVENGTFAVSNSLLHDRIISFFS
jgi:histidinol phosphatase-like enzyme (inositol monophosphatase family)